MAEKRKWCYVRPPAAFEIASCSCGNKDTQWSEFKKHLWCDKCQKDFIPEHYGVLDGPILFGAVKMMGMSFDRLNLETQKVERCEIDADGRIVYIPKMEVAYE